MGFEEYNLIKTTMLEVAEKNNSIEAIKSKIGGVESRKKDIRAGIAISKKEIKEMKSEYDFDNEKVETYESEIKSYERAITASENTLIPTLVTFVVGTVVTMIAIANDDPEGNLSSGVCCFFVIIFLLVGSNSLDEKEEKSIKRKISYRKNLLKKFNSLPQEIEKLEKSISKKNEEIKESDSEIEDLEKEIEKINSEISDMMDSIKHLIPYADKI